VQAILSIQNEVINSSLDGDHFTFGPAEGIVFVIGQMFRFLAFCVLFSRLSHCLEMAKLSNLATARERESKHCVSIKFSFSIHLTHF
jgi:hypothetical protein